MTLSSSLTMWPVTLQVRIAQEMAHLHYFSCFQHPDFIFHMVFHLGCCGSSWDSLKKSIIFTLWWKRGSEKVCRWFPGPPLACVGGRILTSSVLLSLHCNIFSRQLVSAQNYLYSQKLLSWQEMCLAANYPRFFLLYFQLMWCSAFEQNLTRSR